MGRSFADVTGDLANRAFQLRQLRNQEDQNLYDRTLKEAELKTKGVTITPQETHGPRRLFGLLPGETQRTLSVDYDPSLSQTYQKSQADTRRSLAQADLAEAKVNRMKNQSGKPPDNSLTTKYDAYGMPKEYVDTKSLAEIERIKQEAKGVPTSESGKDTLAEEALINIPKARQTLFPDGTSKSFRRDLAFEQKGFMGKKLPLSAEAQNLRRWLGGAIAAKLLVQSGVTTRPEEYERLANDYLGGFTSNPEALYPALEELESFYDAYRRNVRTRGREGYKQEQRQSANVPEWAIGEEAFYSAAKAHGADDATIMQYLESKK